MAERVRLLEPQKIKKNPDNPRLIFRAKELETLEQSIADQGILVPLTVYEDGSTFRLLDGERRWRCAMRLGLSRVPVIVQPKPERLQNLMMMFAIHNARKDWDPLPTALKLQDLEKEFRRRHQRAPTEKELSGLSSLTRGEVRRLKKLLGLPPEYITELLEELEKDPTEQTLTVDQVLEATKAAELLKKSGATDNKGEERLRRAIIKKFRTGVINNTTAPRKLTRLARAVRREEVSQDDAAAVIDRLIVDKSYDIESAFQDSVEKVDFEHSFEHAISRVLTLISEHRTRRYRVGTKLRDALTDLYDSLGSFLGTE
jgi:ParB/RepB/Spo0J family partition protein